MKQLNLDFGVCCCFLCISMCAYLAKQLECCNTYNDKHGLYVVNCSRCNLNNIPFAVPLNVSILYLSNNNLQKLHNKMFDRFTRLQKLFISNNSINRLEEHAFYGLESLTELDLSENNLNIFKDYSKHLFFPIKTILRLDISKNMKQPGSVEKTQYPDHVFRILTSLEYLAVDVMPNPVFGEDFRFLKKLRHLKFSRCFLLFLDHATLKNFHTSINHLEISGCNQFVRAKPDAFVHFPLLKILDLSHSYFHPFQALRLLQPFQSRDMDIINFNHINRESFDNEVEYPYLVNISRDHVKYLQKICVKQLDISENNIVDFENRSLFTFDQPKCINTLKMSSNRIEFSLGYRFRNIKRFLIYSTNLTSMDYSYIPLNIMKKTYHTDHERTEPYSKSDGLVFPKSLQNLKLSYVMQQGIEKNMIFGENSQLRSLDISYSHSAEKVFYRGSRLEHLDVSGMNFAMILKGAKTLKSSRKLKSLVMQDTNFFEMYLSKQNVFKYTPYVHKLDISNNFLWNLEKNTFSSMKNLQNINIGKNRFRHIPSAILTIKNLRNLDMTSNHLSTVDKTVREHFDHLNAIHGAFSLHLGNNGFVCGCENSDFVWWLHTTNVTLDYDTYKCLLSNGSTSDTRSVYQNFNYHFSSCKSPMWLKIGVGLIVSIFVIFLPFSVIYNMRWRLAYFFYKRFRKALEKQLEVDFMYDVYAFYPVDEFSWIKTVLLPQIEDQWGLKLCIEHRNVLPGQPIAEAIADSIEQSRHAIFLVSSSFKNEHWGGYAINRAKLCHFTGNLQKIIVITKNCSSEQVPSELRLIWRDIIHIDIGYDDEQLQAAWNKLRFCLFLNHPNN